MIDSNTLKFKVGDYVYYDSGGDGIGQISNVHESDDGVSHYRINYCQFKDPDRGISGGNGPIWRDGFPKPVTKPTDILFVAAMKEMDKIKSLEIELKETKDNFSALKRARELIKEQDDES